MTKIYIERAFTLQHREKKLEFSIGSHDVDKEVAEHWYTKLHTGKEPSEAKYDNDKAADELLIELDSKAAELASKEGELVKLRDELAAREAAINEQSASIDAEKKALAEREAALLAREAAIKAKEEVSGKTPSKHNK